MAGSKVSLETPLQMALDVARVRLLYASGVWRLPREHRAGAPPRPVEELSAAPEYVELDAVAEKGLLHPRGRGGGGEQAQGSSEQPNVT